MLQSIITCPKCSYQTAEEMPVDACQFFYDCKGCGERLKPLPEDCCVFCSYGSVWLGAVPSSPGSPELQSTLGLLKDKASDGLF